MGRHDEGHGHARAAQVDGLETLSIQAWDVVGASQVAIFGTYKTPEGPKSQHFGQLHLPYPILSLPSLGQVLWTLGDEVRSSYRSLTPPA